MGPVAASGRPLATVAHTTSPSGCADSAGGSPPLASKTAGSGRGPWYLARSKALSVGLSNAYFRSLGLPSLIEDG